MRCFNLLLLSIILDLFSSLQLIKQIRSPSIHPEQSLHITGNNELYPVDFMYLSNVKIDVDFYGEMAVLLYTNKTFAAKCLPDFLLYNCTYYIHCTWNNLKPFELLMPYFNLSGYMIETEFFLGGVSGQADWGGGFMDVYYAQNCTGGFTSSILYGAIGMGIDGGDYKNYLQEVSFSILISPDGEEGYLAFGDEYTVVDQNLVTNLTSGISNNWHIPIENISFKNNSMPSKARTVFDLSSSSIFMPVDYLEIIMQWLMNEEIRCSTDSYINPVCTVAGSVHVDPIIFQTTEGEVLQILSSVYLQYLNENLYYLIFIGTTTNSSMVNAQLINEDYKDVIFIGSQYMFGKLITFNFADLKSLYITIYTATIPSTIEYNDIIFELVMGFIFAVIIFTVFKIKNKTSKQKDDSINEYEPVPTFVDTLTPGGDE